MAKPDIIIVGLQLSNRLRSSNSVAEAQMCARFLMAHHSAGSASTGVEPGKVILTLRVGETVHVVAVYHGENFDGFKVTLVDGTEGLIMARDTFKFVSR